MALTQTDQLRRDHGHHGHDEHDLSDEHDVSDDADATFDRPPQLRSDRGERMIRHLRRAVELSYPLYTFSELKRILRCEYHRLVSVLRSDSSKTWGELTLLTGMTRAGLNKLGDEVPPRATHSGIRLLILILQEAGSEGLSLPKLASRYYEQCPEFVDGPSFEEALRALIETGEVVEREQRYVCASHSQRNELLADDVEATVGRIVDAIRAERGFGVAQLHRISLRVPADPEAQRDVLQAMKNAVCKVAIEAEEACERLGGEQQWLTVVVGGGPVM